MILSVLITVEVFTIIVLIAFRGVYPSPVTQESVLIYKIKEYFLTCSAAKQFSKSLLPAKIERVLEKLKCSF